MGDILIPAPGSTQAAPSYVVPTDAVGGGVAVGQTGQAVPGDAVVVGGSDGTALRVLGLAQGHSGDNQPLPTGGAYGVVTSGIGQTYSPAGTTDRQRGTGFDGVPAQGIPAGAQQLFVPFSPAPTFTGGGAPGVRTVTATAVSGVVNGVAWSIQPGSYLVVDSGANQEIVYVTAVAGSTFTATFGKTHNGAGLAIVGGVYNQARDAAGVVEGVSPVGVSPSLTMLWNQLLNGGAGGIEFDRSANGELDGASGKGTAVAAEYEFNGGGPIGAGAVPTGQSFDRARNLAGKGLGSSTVNGTVAAGVSSITLTSVAGLVAGSSIVLSNGTARAETIYAAGSYVPGTLAVALASPTQSTHLNGDSCQWDIFAGASSTSSGGPGLSGMLPTGLGVEEEVVYDPVSGLYYCERSSTQDGVSAQNVVLETPGLWNGASIDRARSVSIGDGAAATGIAAEALMGLNPAGSFDRVRSTASLSAAMAENVPGSVKTAAAGYALDPAAAAGSQQVPLQVESSAQPNLRTSLWQAGNEASVKAASVAAVAADKALVVAVSPNNNVAVIAQPSATGGTTKVRVRNLGAVAAVKAAAGTLYALQVVNNQAATAFVQLFDLAVGSVTLGTTTPDMEFQVAANSSLVVQLPMQGVAFGVAISIASTTAEGGNTTSAAGVQAFAQYA